MPKMTPEEKAARRKARYLAHRVEILVRQRQRRQIDPETEREAWQRYYASHREQEKERTKRYRSENKEKLRAYADKNREKIQAYRKAYYQAHKEEKLAYGREYEKTHQESIRIRKNAYDRQRYKTHTEQFSNSTNRRRARVYNAKVSDFTSAQWRAMQEHYKHCCAYCGKRAKGHLTQDHITPLAKGGNHTFSNIVPACLSCNQRKHAGPVHIPVQPLLLL